jgi:hypothetical protein
MSKSAPNVEPRVGVFWVEGTIIHSHSVALSEGLPYGEAVNGPMDHVEFWPELERRHAHLRGREYFELPRGRVVFRRGENRFAVMMDRKLHTPSMKSALRRNFSLPAKRTVFERDAHYTTDAKQLGQLLASEFFVE